MEKSARHRVCDSRFLRSQCAIVVYAIAELAIAEFEITKFAMTASAIMAFPIKLEALQ